MLALFPTYIWSMNVDIIHQVILSYQVIWHMVMTLLSLDITEGYEEVMKIYRPISYRLEFASYPVLFPIILKNIAQQYLCFTWKESNSISYFQIVHLHLDSFNFGIGSDCNSNEVTMYDGPTASSREIASFCGNFNNIQRDVYSSGYNIVPIFLSYSITKCRKEA